MTLAVLCPAMDPRRSGLSLRLALPTPPAVPVRRERRRRPAPRRQHPAQTPSAGPLPRYSLAHAKGSNRQILGTQKRTTVHFAAAPIHFIRPEKGVLRTKVTCLTCQKQVTVLVRSPGAVTLERVKRVVYVALTALVFYGLVVLIPWERLVGNNENCVGLLALFAFGILALHNAAVVIAPDSALVVDIAGKPLLDIFPTLPGQGTHSILRQQ